MVVVSRIHRMTPEPGSPHLSRFKREYRKHRKYLILPISARVEPQFDLAIEKSEVHFRETAAIKANDVDAVVFPKGYFDHDGAVQ